MHDGGALGEVRAEPDPVGVGDPDPGGQHVVGHPGELVDPEHGDVPCAAVSPHPGQLEAVDGTGPGVVHTTLVSRPKMPVEVDRVRARRAGG